MSYANGTTHYNLPQTVGTDKRDWFDTNEAFAAIDAALYGAVQTSTETATALETLAGRVTTVEGKQATDEATLAEHTTKIGALETLGSQHTAAIADVRQDAEDMISANNEGAAATSTRVYAVGNYFIYNDVLYKATAPIAIGDTIVPNTNCEATNVATELLNYTKYSVVADGVKTRAQLLNELHALAGGAAITPLSFIKRNNAIYQYVDNTSGGYEYTLPSSTTSELRVVSLYLKTNASYSTTSVVDAGGFTHTDSSSIVESSGTTFDLYIAKDIFV